MTTNAIELRNILLDLIGTYLGEYDQIRSPSIWIVPPQLPNYTIKNKLGVEAIVDRSSDLDFETIGGYKLVACHNWNVILIQHDPNKTLNDSIIKIASSFQGIKSRIRQQQQTPDGLFLEQATIRIPAKTLANRPRF
jgi:hypothetical protein